MEAIAYDRKHKTITESNYWMHYQIANVGLKRRNSKDTLSHRPASAMNVKQLVHNPYPDSCCTLSPIASKAIYRA
jgi:hypothetical protein